MLGAQTQGMIGYWLVQEHSRTPLPGTAGRLPDLPDTGGGRRPGFRQPTKFVGPVYSETEARQARAGRGWEIRQDGTAWRRVVASPEPVGIVELDDDLDACSQPA